MIMNNLLWSFLPLLTIFIFLEGRQMSFHPFASRRTWLYHVAESTFSELDSGLLSDKRIGASCAILGLKNGSRVPVIVGGKSSEVSPLQTSHKMSQIEIFDPQTKVWNLMSQPIPVITDHVRKIVLESFTHLFRIFFKTASN
jgi:hypothetical protein